MITKKNNFGFQPSATNAASSKDKFFQRLSYDISFEINMIIKEMDRNDFLDTRNYFLYYGRLDNKKNIINVSENNLKNIPDNRNIYALNFVCDAFEGLMIDSKIAGDLGKITNEKFTKLRPKKAWSNVHLKYHNHMNEIFKLYLKFLKNTNKEKTIINFNSFLKNFIIFADRSFDKTPFLKSSFVVGIDCDINDSGLVVEIDNSKKDLDQKKISDYYQMEDFYTFQNIAKNHGFSIDKDCPWRLIFNVNSQFSDRYMNKYGLNKENVYDQYYYKTINYDIENLKRYLLIFYNSIIASKPNITITNIENIENNLQISSLNIVRTELTLDELEIDLPNSVWFKLYCYMFLIENRVKLTQKQFNLLINELVELNNISFNLVRNKLNEIVDTYEKTNNKIYNFAF